MPCAETLGVQAYIDGEVSGAQAAEVERHLEGCAECQAFCEEAAALSDDIRRLAPRFAAPADLRRQVGSILDEEDVRRQVVSIRTKVPSRDFWTGAFGGAGLTALAAALGLLAILPPAPATLVDQVTSAHTRALMRGRTIAVVSSDHHTVKPWFAGRAPLSPPVTDFAQEGFKLTGGRLDRVAGRPAAVVVYQHGKHEIDLFVWADRGSALPATGLRHGYHSIFWKTGDLDFAAVSDTQTAELADFAGLVRRSAE